MAASGCRCWGRTDGEVTTRVEEGGPLGEHKGINLPGVAVSSPAITDKDRIDMAFGLQELQVDYVALSFVRTADEVRAAHDLMRSLGRTVPLVVKLEKSEAIDNLEAIVQVADAVMVARGDLGVELAPELVPMLQKRIVQQANQRGIPVITATQMLESMITEETPTRAEASDVANAVWDGSDAVMLSAETATGRHPLLVLRMMDRIARAAESTEAVPAHISQGQGDSTARLRRRGDPRGAGAGRRSRGERDRRRDALRIDGRAAVARTRAGAGLCVQPARGRLPSAGPVVGHHPGAPGPGRRPAGQYRRHGAVPGRVTIGRQRQHHRDHGITSVRSRHAHQLREVPRARLSPVSFQNRTCSRSIASRSRLSGS